IAFMQQMYAFIGVDANFTPDTSRKAQTAQVPKNQTLNRLLKTENPIRSAASGLLRALLPEAARSRLRSQVISLNSGSKKQGLSAEDRALLQDYYREDILKLQELIQRDLSAWLK
ncbi:MAG: sulfotransferase, partial [Cyanobacteria bacterium P01_G01_bin.38]